MINPDVLDPATGRLDPDRLDDALIAQVYPAECVRWVCDEHRRRCQRIGTEHTEHACFWCDHA